MDCCYGLDGVSATNRLCSCFRKAEVFNLAYLNQVLHCSCHIFDGHIRVNTVLIEEVNRLDPEPLEGALHYLLDVLGPTIQPLPAPLELPVGTEILAEFGADHYLVPEGGQRFAHQFLVRERTVDLGGVEEGDAALDGTVRSSPQSRVSLTQRGRFAGYGALRNCVGAMPTVRRNT